MATQAELVAISYEYADLLLAQYVNSPRARKTVSLLAYRAMCDLVQLDVQDAFSLETASGAQLDVLGKYIGLSRNIPAIIDRYYFELRDYADPTTGEAGFTDYIDASINVDSSFYLYTFANTAFYTLSDAEYRPLLLLKIILNQSNNSLATIANDLFASFGTDIICFDGQDMTIAYAMKTSATTIAHLALQADLLPKPMGVLLSGVFIVSDPTKLLGFQSYEYNNGNDTGFSSYVTGWNGQNWLNYKDRVS